MTVFKAMSCSVQMLMMMMMMMGIFSGERLIPRSMKSVSPIVIPGVIRQVADKEPIASGFGNVRRDCLSG